MFTGIIIDVAEVTGLRPAAYGATLSIRPAKGIDVKASDSVGINGVCLTLTGKTGNDLTFDVVRETLNRSTLGALKTGDKVNLETSLKVGDPLGGHFVQGHVDAVCPIVNISSDPVERLVRVDCPPQVNRLIAEKGSVAIDGVSLTVASVDNRGFTVKIIPYTWNETTLRMRKVGDLVNIETDMLARYVARLMGEPAFGLTEDFLRQAGF